MDASTIVYGLLLAVVGAATIVIVINIPFYCIRRRLLQRFAQLHCGKCQKPFGIESVRSGKDVSPFEEIWSDGKDHLIHNHPTCLSVVCSHCQRTWVLRHNSRGEQFGPELSVNEPKTAYH